MQAVHFDAVEKQLPTDSALMSTATAPAAGSSPTPEPASAPEAPLCALHTGLEGVPVKFVLVRRGVVVERRRTRLVSPTFEDVKRCARQWACGDFGVRYVDDEGDVVAVDVEEEWAECVSLWCQQAGQAGSGARPALCLVVELRERARGSAHSQAAAPQHPQHPQHPLMGLRGWRRHHARMHADAAGDSMTAAGCGVQDVQQEQQQACCRRSVKHPGKHGRRCSNANTDTDAAVVEKPTRSAVCAAEGCTRTVGGLHKTHCCRRCAEEGAHAHAHGPRCQRRAAAQVSGKVADSSSSDKEVAQQQKEQGCAGCAFQLTGVHATHCCRRCAKKGGDHGKKCAQRACVLRAAGTPAVDAATSSDSDVEQVQVQQACCRRSVKHPGKHGRRCSNVNADAATATASHSDAPAAMASSSNAEMQPHTQVPQEAQQQQQELAAGQAVCAAQVCCAGCGFQVTGVHTTHCCRRCAKKSGQHGPHCARRVFQTDVEVDVQEAEEAVMAADVARDDEAEHLVVGVVADPDLQQTVPEAVPVVCADLQPELEAVPEPESDSVRTLQRMGFEMTDALRALMWKHNGDVPRVLEELL